MLLDGMDKRGIRCLTIPMTQSWERTWRRENGTNCASLCARLRLVGRWTNSWLCTRKRSRMPLWTDTTHLMMMTGKNVKNRMCLRVLPKCMLRQARIHQLDRLTTKHHLVLYGRMPTTRMHTRCLRQHLRLLCKLEGIQGSSMHVNTTRNGKIGLMIPMTTLGLRMRSKTRRMTSLGYKFLEMWCRRMRILQRLKLLLRPLLRLPTATVLMETVSLQDFQNSMRRFLYLLQQRQTHRYCLHLQLEVRKRSRSRKAKGRAMTKVGSLMLQKVASQNSRKVVSQNLRKVAKMRRVARMTKVARMWQRENSKVNPKEKKETKGSRVQKGQHCLLPKLLVRSVHVSPKSLRRLWKAIRTKCMTMVLWPTAPRDGMRLLSRIRMLKVPAVSSEAFRLFPTPATPRHCFQWCSQDCRQPTRGMKTGRMPQSTMKRSISMCHNLHGSRIHITGHARFSRWAVLPKSPSPTMTLLWGSSTKAWRSAATQRRWLASSVRNWPQRRGHRVLISVPS